MKQKYKCIGLEEKIVSYWNTRFTIGLEYEVCEDDTTTEHLFLYDNDSEKCYVDKCQFDKVPPVQECKQFIAYAESFDPDLTSEQADYVLDHGVSFKLEPRCETI
ncbi:MAG: hypothetical protein ACEPOW_13890 [Bacteroidales bacterium]